MARRQAAETPFSLDGEPVWPFMSTASFAEMSVIPADMMTKVSPEARRKFSLDHVVSHRLALDEITRGFAMMKSGEALRSVVLY